MKPALRFTLLPLAFATTCALAEVNKIYLIFNDTYKGRAAIELDAAGAPCVTPGLLSEWGVRQSLAASLATTPGGCISPDEPGVQLFYEPISQLLTVDVAPRMVGGGDISHRWDDGVNAGFIDYQLNYGHYSAERYRDAERRYSLFAEWNTGLNLGAWRLRYQPIYQKDAWGQPSWHTEKALAYRDLKAWRALLSIGDNHTPSTLFDNVKYRGIQLASDDRMLPESLRQFSPWIRGMARSNAEIKVRQNGEVIYQTFVSPGAFILKDVYPPDPDGDITVTVRESDGTETERKLPYSSMPNLVHGGRFRYDLTLGKYQPYFGIEQQQPQFGQLSVSYGLPAKTTLYGGVLLSGPYRSAAVGVGKSFNQWGALSADYNYAAARQPRRGADDRGGMWRLRYARTIPSWESSVSLLAQYYPRQRYRTFGDAVEQQTLYWWDWEDDLFIGDFDAEKKYRLEARYNQYFSESDSLYLTLAREAKRGQDKGETSVELGYSATWGEVDVNLYAEYSRRNYGKEQGQIGLSFSVPLGKLALPRMKLNYDHRLAKNGAGSRRVGVSGTLLSDYSLSYDLSTSQSQSAGSSQDASASYQYNAGSLRLGYARGRNYRQQNIELAGSLMAHAGGVTLGQTLGETMAIVQVPGAAGIGIDNQYGVTTDWRGYAVVSTLTPYRVNRLSLDTFELPDDEELPQPEIEVVPTAGAIMFSRFAPAQTLTPPDAARTSSPE
ncbi:P pilus assembly protein, porin PapC [Serratia sp. FGI94]|uniref:fimbria/pilus outer membrane usher protein n=1 Tax=Serratia sp. FGI94 TaxID=671990 RepID=UPI0002A72CEF|nr:fimbria/pilus outer membrane usher protein [Serratia sp. FGI94]AGB83966.1 P pilus assembly protein, porin PapC [Serratia sp. FGI94]